VLISRDAGTLCGMVGGEKLTINTFTGGCCTGHVMILSKAASEKKYHELVLSIEALIISTENR
jgi:hypothetical protein